MELRIDSHMCAPADSISHLLTLQRFGELYRCFSSGATRRGDYRKRQRCARVALMAIGDVSNCATGFPPPKRSNDAFATTSRDPRHSSRTPSLTLWRDRSNRSDTRGLDDPASWSSGLWPWTLDEHSTPGFRRMPAITEGRTPQFSRVSRLHQRSPACGAQFQITTPWHA